MLQLGGSPLSSEEVFLIIATSSQSRSGREVRELDDHYCPLGWDDVAVMEKLLLIQRYYREMVLCCRHMVGNPEKDETQTHVCKRNP